MFLNRIFYEESFELIKKWSWSEIKYGLEKSFITCEDVILYARNILDEDTEDFDLVLNLSIANENEVADVLISLISNEKTEDDNIIRSKWIFSFVYNSFIKAYDISQVIDEVYTTFNYPDEISMLVGYMPCEDCNTIDERIEQYIKDGKIMWIL